MKLKHFAQHPLITGSTLIISGSFFANIFNFIFSWYMIGALKQDYALLAALVSLITLPSVVAGAIMPLIVTYAASYFATKNFKKAHGLYITVTKFQFCIGMIVFLLSLLSMKYIGDFFHVTNHFLLMIASLAILINFLAVVNNSFLQARLAFGFTTILNILAAGAKLFFGVFIVSLGFSSQGAFIGVFLSILIPFLLSYIPLRFLFKRGVVTEKIEAGELFYYGFPAALATLGLNMFINNDILLVQHFFQPQDASMYAALSLPAKVIFYLTAPISTVMFPLIVQKKSKKENFTNTFFLSLLLVLLPSIAIVIFEFLFSDFVLQVFRITKTTAYEQGLLGMFGLFITTFAILSVVINFYLAIHKTRIFIPILFFSMVQGVLMWFNHQSFMQVISVSLTSSLLLLVVLLLYYPYATKQK